MKRDGRRRRLRAACTLIHVSFDWRRRVGVCNSWCYRAITYSISRGEAMAVLSLRACLEGGRLASPGRMNIHASSSRLSYSRHDNSRGGKTPNDRESQGGTAVLMARLVSSFSPSLPYFHRPSGLDNRRESIGLPFPIPSERLASTSHRHPFTSGCAAVNLPPRSVLWLHHPPTPPNRYGRFACSLTKLPPSLQSPGQSLSRPRQPLGPLTLHAWPWC